MTDPVYAAVDAFIASKKAFMASPERADFKPTPEEDDMQAKLDALARIVPTTKAGAAHLAAFLLDEEQNFIGRESPLIGLINNLVAAMPEEPAAKEEWPVWRHALSGLEPFVCDVANMIALATDLNNEFLSNITGGQMNDGRILAMGAMGYDMNQLSFAINHAVHLATDLRDRFYAALEGRAS